MYFLQTARKGYVLMETPSGPPFLYIYGSKSNGFIMTEDTATERFCYHRRTTSDADKETLCGLIGGDAFTLATPYEAYVVTWINATTTAGPTNVSVNKLTAVEIRYKIIL
jgi:hypothetical protein